ncbi:hypothetical protein GCM10009858_04980 [Terrabacter carboxydivorans]|uniref:Uncharacterized protein n=1 Tax=Terrabacter carboxydivorans TaxID=619730 RepID=A0ABN3KVC7_9MICO
MFDSSEAALIDDPIDRNDANEPTLPIDSTDPTLPIESTDPVDPIDRNESRDAIDHFPLRDLGMRPSLGTACRRPCRNAPRPDLPSVRGYRAARPRDGGGDVALATRTRAGRMPCRPVFSRAPSRSTLRSPHDRAAR